jgi:hypothetical protein
MIIPTPVSWAFNLAPAPRSLFRALNYTCRNSTLRHWELFEIDPVIPYPIHLSTVNPSFSVRGEETGFKDELSGAGELEDQEEKEMLTRMQY